MNNCSAVRDLLALRPDDWNADERSRIKDHLEGCEDCAVVANAYSEQDSLMVALPRLRFTPLQKEQLAMRIGREAQRRDSRTRLFSALGTAATVAVLAAFTIALYLLFGGQEPLPATGIPAPSVTPSVAAPTATVDPNLTTPTPIGDAVLPPRFPVFAQEVRINGFTLQTSTGEEYSSGLDEYSLEDLPLLDTFTTPISAGITLKWQVLDAPTADWVAFMHWLDKEGQLIVSSDVAVDWPEQACPADTYDSQCGVKSEFEWNLDEDVPDGLYTLVVGLYDPKSGMRAPVTYPKEISPPQVALGRVQLLSEESPYRGAQVTLRIFSGRPNPVWLLTPEQVDDLRGRLAQLSLSDRPYDAAGGLGYSGLLLQLPGSDGQTSQNIEVWKGLVRWEEYDRIRVLDDTNRVLEQWLLETGVGEVEDAYLEIARAEPEIPTPVPKGGLAFYLTAPETELSMLTNGSLDALILEETPILTATDILLYSSDSHELRLTSSASERLYQLDVPVTGRGFVITVDNERIYSGAFWTPASSLSFAGVVILVPPVGEMLPIQLGYPGSDFFQGEDRRGDSRILELLEASGKLH